MLLQLLSNALKTSSRPQKYSLHDHEADRTFLPTKNMSYSHSNANPTWWSSNAIKTLDQL